MVGFSPGGYIRNPLPPPPVESSGIGGIRREARVLIAKPGFKCTSCGSTETKVAGANLRCAYCRGFVPFTLDRSITIILQ